MTVAEFIELLEKFPGIAEMQIRIGAVERKQYAHETHDIDEISIQHDSFGTAYVEISEIPF